MEKDKTEVLMLCTLCDSSQTVLVPAVKSSQKYYHCQNCDLVMKSPETRLSKADEKHRYDQHNNDMESPGYANFFEKLLVPLRPYLKNQKTVLDWGSGPGKEPVLAQLLRKENLEVDLYDPFYQPHLKSQTYDVITSTEVIEHFDQPKKTFQEILPRLKKSGIFAGMTLFHKGPETIENWWYSRDPTHLVFYSEKTIQWIAKEWKLEICYLQDPVFILRKI